MPRKLLKRKSRLMNTMLKRLMMKPSMLTKKLSMVMRRPSSLKTMKLLDLKPTRLPNKPMIVSKMLMRMLMKLKKMLLKAIVTTKIQKEKTLRLMRKTQRRLKKKHHRLS